MNARACIHMRKLQFASCRSDTAFEMRIDGEKGAFVDKHETFVLDKSIFSSIIYILYEGARLRPLIVNT
jgi:hypothetical protein